MTVKKQRTGYHIDAKTGDLCWVPPGWNYSLPVIIAPATFTRDAMRAQRDAHSHRIGTRTMHGPDWPPYLLACYSSRPKPWRLVLLDPFTGQRGFHGWYHTMEGALAVAKAARLGWATPAQQEQLA